MLLPQLTVNSNKVEFREVGGDKKFILKHREFVLSMEYPKGKVWKSLALQTVKVNNIIQERQERKKEVETEVHKEVGPTKPKTGSISQKG